MPIHPLAEKIYEILDEHGYWDEDFAESRQRNVDRMNDTIRRSRRRTRSQRNLRLPGTSTRKAKRKVSAYQREFGIQLKKLKKKHPRTPVTRLMKRAHTATRKIMKKRK